MLALRQEGETLSPVHVIPLPRDEIVRIHQA